MARKKHTVEQIIGNLRGYRRMHGCADGLPAQRDVLLEEMERLVPREASAEQFVERWETRLNRSS